MTPRQLEQVNDIVEMVRGSLTVLERQCVSVTIVLDVHARDTVATLLARGTACVHDFEWRSQLRYYWQVRKCCLITHHVLCCAETRRLRAPRFSFPAVYPTPFICFPRGHRDIGYMCRSPLVPGRKIAGTEKAPSPLC